MASVGFKKMNWFPKPSAWTQMETARLKRRQMIDDFRAETSALSAAFQTAQTMQIQGVGDLAVKSVQSRLQARAKEMRADFDQQYARISKLA